MLKIIYLNFECYQYGVPIKVFLPLVSFSFLAETPKSAERRWKIKTMNF